MAKPITQGSFNDPRATSKMVGGQEGYAKAVMAWRIDKAHRDDLALHGYASAEGRKAIDEIIFGKA